VDLSEGVIRCVTVFACYSSSFFFLLLLLPPRLAGFSLIT